MEDPQEPGKNEHATEQPQAPAEQNLQMANMDDIPTDALLSLKSEDATFKVTGTSHSVVSAPGEYHPHYEYTFTIQMDGGSVLSCKHRFNDFKLLQKQIGFKALPGPQKWWYTGGQDEEYAVWRE